MLSAPLRYIVAGILAIVSCIIGVAIVFQSPPMNEAATAILLTTFLISTFFLFVRSLEPLQSLPTMFVMFYFSFFYALPGAVQIASNSFTMGDVTYSPEVAVEGALIALTFLIAFLVGQSFVGRQHYDKSLAAIEQSERSPRVLAITLFMAIAILLGLICIARFGPSALMKTRGDFGGEIEAAGLQGADFGLVLMLPRAMSVLALPLLFYAIARWRREKPAMNALIAWPIMALMLPIFLLLNYPPALPRNWQFGVLLTFVFVFVRGWRPWLRIGLVCGMLLTMFSLFQWLNVLRHYDEAGAISESIESPIEYLKHMDLDGYQTTMNTVIFTELYDHAYGKQIMAALLFPIPRAIWTDKGESSGPRVARNLGYRFTLISTPLPAEFFFDFSFAGVIVGGFIVGYLYRRMDYVCAAGIDFGRPNIQLIIIAIITGFTIFLMRGTLYAVANIFGPLAILAFLLLKAPAIARLIMPPSNKPGGTASSSPQQP
jgi:hypothetical protein